MTIKEAARGNGYVPLLFSGSVKLAQEIIEPDETILYAGIFNSFFIPVKDTEQKISSYSSNGARAGVICITNKRIIHSNTGANDGTPHFIPLNEILSTKHSINLGIARQIIKSAEHGIIIDGSIKQIARAEKALESAIAAAQDSPDGETSS